MMSPKGFTGLTAMISGMVVILAGCGPDQQREQASARKEIPKHEHVPPHGGTAVELGEEEFHLELVLDRASGRLTAYILDSHLENFVRIQASTFEIEAKIAASARPLIFQAVADQSTGEKVGDTSMFEVTADWLKSVESFDGKLNGLEIKGKRYSGVVFNFPKGNEASVGNSGVKP